MKLNFCSVLAVIGLCAPALLARELFVAPSGADGNAGAIDAPLATIAHAIDLAQPDDTIWVRAGTYALTDTLKISSKKIGAADKPFTLSNYKNEVVDLDFSKEPDKQRGIELDGDYWHLVGLGITRAKDNGIHISGSHNTLERLRVSRNGDTGVQISGSTSRQPSNNLILNTDSFENYDPSAHGENADGFAAKFRNLGQGNVFRGCRAWHNSDDGWDFWMAAHGVTVENCWAFENGYNYFGDTKFQGDGNGIKLGHDSGRHVVKNCLFVGNAGNGVDVNGNAYSRKTKLLAAATQPGATQPAGSPEHGVTVSGVVCIRNRLRNFVFDEPFPHLLQNNESIDGGMEDEIDPAVISKHSQGEEIMLLAPKPSDSPRGRNGELPTPFPELK
ncbi:MAG: Pectate lyase [Phycisphaerales bacterium]|nr:Pectate lyase [Phycisphaerales bacterium]